MKLTPGQLRETLGLSQDTYRHWKQALSPLAGRNGYRPCFTLGDLLALAMVKALIEDAGMRVGALQPVAEALFRICNASPWAALERSILVVELADVHVAVMPEDQTRRAKGISIQAPCRPIVGRLREKLLTEQGEEPQQTLRFPPAAVGARRRSIGSDKP
jgi:hypothetical protein